MISGLLPLEAEIHTKVFTMFGNITRAHTNSNADFASNIAMYVGLLRSLFSRSNSSTSNSQRSGDEFFVNPFCSGFVDENIRKARRATYSLMGTGLHGENGLDPETSISNKK
jgi:hypothetical protein